jgi:hypothetical protein
MGDLPKRPTGGNSQPIQHSIESREESGLVACFPQIALILSSSDSYKNHGKLHILNGSSLPSVLQFKIYSGLSKATIEVTIYNVQRPRVVFY